MRLFILIFILLSFGCKGERATSWQPQIKSNTFLQLPLPAPSPLRTGSGAPGSSYWQQQVDHTINAALDVETNSIVASQVVKYKNNSPDTLTYIWFQLEQNIHRGDSIRSREGRGTGEDSYDGIVITKLKVDGKDATLIDFGTLAKVVLDKPLLPNKAISISMDWSFPVATKASLRMGYDDSYEAGPVWELAQWIPVPCVYDDVYGWNTLPYIGRGEFYTNFGDYIVELTVPSNHLVFGSGDLVNAPDVLTTKELAAIAKARQTEATVTVRSKEEISSSDDTTSTWKFEGKNIRTFAWATSASFIWDAASVEIETPSGKKERVLCQAAYPVEVEEFWDEAVSYVQHAIKYYSETLYPYPWPQMTVVRGRAGGMEYPMIVYCRGNSHEGLFNVTDHEVAHNWFPMLVNTDERRHAWMDEGFNTFVNHYSLEAFYGDREHKPDVPSYDAKKYANVNTAINTPPDFLQSRRHLSYRKPGYGLRFLREEILGEERFDSAFKDYVTRWAFKSPRPADFYRTMEDSSGVDLQWFFRGFFEEPRQLDQAIVDVQHSSDGVTITFENIADWVCPVALSITCEDGSAHQFKLPVTIWAWSSTHHQSFTLPSPALVVEIDAKNAYPDIDRSNNKWTN